VVPDVEDQSLQWLSVTIQICGSGVVVPGVVVPEVLGFRVFEFKVLRFSDL
jgi:hypothetical protein